MSQQLSDAEGKLLFERLNRRTKSLSSLMHGPVRWWVLIHFLSLAGIVVIALAARSRVLDPILLVSVAGILLIATAVSFALVNKRIDTLIEILREDGQLGSAPPVARANCRER